MKRHEACDVVYELVRCWKRDRDGSAGEQVGEAFQSIGFEFGLRFTLNYPEYAVALRNALDDCSTGDGAEQRFLKEAATIIERNPIEAIL